MGLQIAGLMVMTLVILVLTLMSQVSVDSNLMTSQAATQTIDSTGDRVRTNLEFVDNSAAVGELTVELKNTGFTSVFDFSKMDFIVEYLDAADNEVITRLTYTTGALANNEWKKTSIIPDGFQPNAWDPSENITLDAKLFPAQKGGTSATIIVATPNGVAAKSSFGADGFFWFVNAPDVSLTTTASWQDIDLSAHVPTGTTGVIVEVVNTGNTGDLSGVIRGKEDARDYMSNVIYEAMVGETHRWQIVKVDSNLLIQGYIENTNIDFKLRGYTLGSDPSYFSNPPDVTPATKGQWETVDVTANVDSDADGVILFVDSTEGGEKEYALREMGSTFLDPSGPDKNLLSRYSNTMYLVGINAADQFQVWLEEVLTMKIYLIGQTKGSVIYNLEDVAVADPTTGSWQEVDADDYNIPAAANGIFFRVGDSGSSTKAGFRHGDSTDDWNGDIEKETHLFAGTGINADNVWDEYLENSNLDVYIAAYTVPLTE